MLERMPGVRVVSTRSGLEAMLGDEGWPTDSLTFRFAFDELLTFGELDEELVRRHDPYAIVAREASFFGMWMTPEEGRSLMERHCEWAPPPSEDHPTQAQGAVAGIPTKIWFTSEKWLFLVQSPYLQDFRERTR